MTKLVGWFTFVFKIIFLGIMGNDRLSEVVSKGIFWTLYMTGCWLLCRECSRESNVLFESNLIDNLGLC